MRGTEASRSVCRYQSVARDSGALIMRIREITQTRVHYGYRRGAHDAAPGRLARQSERGLRALS